MSKPTTPKVLDDTVYAALAHSVCTAALAGRRGLSGDGSDIFAAWSAFVPNDGLGPVGLALNLAMRGRKEDAIALLEACPGTVERADQVRDTLETLRSSGASQNRQMAGPASLKRFPRG